MHVQILASLFQNDFFCKVSSFLDMYLILVITFFVLVVVHLFLLCCILLFCSYSCYNEN